MGAWVPAVALGASVTGTGALLGFLVAGRVGAVVLGLLSVPFAITFGRAVRRGRPYAGRRGALRCLVDATWSSLNTWAGAVYYGLHRLAGNTHVLAKSSGRGSIWLEKGVVRKYATTIGPVKAGSTDRIDRHEEVHVFQARLFGPFYLPLVALNYVIATVVPYWLLFRDEERYPITGVASYFENGVYPHVWNELWAYRVSRRPHR
jgi:hypothetical protein